MSAVLLNRKAIITGAGSGIGAATMARFVSEGAKVLGLDIKAPPGQPIIQCDVSDIDALPEIVERTIAELDGVDILVNCAGTSIREAASELSWEAYDSVMRANLHAPVMLMSLYGRHMAQRGYGRIVNVSSAHARVTNAKNVTYAISKAGLEGATRSFAVGLGPDGVLVNAVAPGFIATPGHNPVAKMESAWFRSTFIESGQIPLARHGEAPEIAECITYLASEANSYLTGQTVAVDGGLTVTVLPTAV